MKQLRTTRSRLPGYSFALLSLAVLVFTWGLQYKLSLYSAPHSSLRQMEQAKLVSNDEQFAALEISVLSSPSNLAPQREAPAFGTWILPLLALSALLFTVCWKHKAVLAEVPRCAAPRAELNAFFFRPPPSRS